MANTPLLVCAAAPWEGGMDRAFTTLLNILKVAAVFQGEHSTLTIVPIEHIVNDLVVGTSLETERTQITSTLTDGFGMDGSIAMAVDTISALAKQIEQQVTNDLAKRFDSVNQTLEDLLLINQLLHSSAVQSATLQLSDPRIFDYVQQWDIEPAPGQPSVTLVGFLNHAPERVQLSLKHDHFVARKTKLAYSTNTPYPRLSLTVPSSAKLSALQSGRTGWDQRPGDEYHLKVFGNARKYAGQIQTGFLELPFIIEGARIHLSFTSTPPLALLATSVLDEDNNVVARCIRITFSR